MKKQIPLIIHKVLEPYLIIKSTDNYIRHYQNDILLGFKDKESNSDFYFNILEYKTEKNIILRIDYKPIDDKKLMNKNLWVLTEDLQKYFNEWKDLLNAYDNVNTIFDNPFIETFSNDFFSEFEIIEENANINPFNIKQILSLDEHLEFIKNRIEEFKDENNINDIDDIKNDIISLQENLTKKPKNWVMRKLSNIYGKIAAQGPKFIKEIANEAQKQIIKKLVALAIDFTKEI